MSFSTQLFNSLKPMFAVNRTTRKGCDYFPRVLASYQTGSSVICDPPVTNTDIDKLLLVDQYPSQEFMESQGWASCLDEPKPTYQGPIQAYRKGAVNIIMTTDKAHYVRTCAATALAKEMNLLSKQDRIELFRVVQGFDYNITKLPGEGGLI